MNIQNPKGYLVKDLLEVLVKPENIGDLHIKMMVKYPQQFSIRKAIVEMFLKSFYKILWNKENDLYQKLELDVLLGDHTESAFIEVRSEDVKKFFKYRNLFFKIYFFINSKFLKKVFK